MRPTALPRRRRLVLLSALVAVATGCAMDASDPGDATRDGAVGHDGAIGHTGDASDVVGIGINDPDSSIGPPPTGSDAGTSSDAADAATVDDEEPIPSDPPTQPPGTPGDTRFSGFAGNYSSPSIVREGANYHVYFAAQTTGGRHYHVPHATFTDTTGVHLAGEALPHLGAHAEENGPVWAPGVIRIDGSHWMLFYSAHLAGTAEKMCIWRAHSNGPEGPFVDDFDGPLVCPGDSRWAIDAYPFADTGGNVHLAARIDQPGGINTIQERIMTANGRDFAAGSDWVELTHNAPGSWEQPVMENAGIVRLAPAHGGAAHWFVFYSGRAWADNSYAIGYADCGPNLGDGACNKITDRGPWFATDASLGIFGPGTPTFYPDTTGAMRMSIQAWEHTGGTANPANTGQIMRTYTIALNDAYHPVLHYARLDH